MKKEADKHERNERLANDPEFAAKEALAKEERVEEREKEKYREL